MQAVQTSWEGFFAPFAQAVLSSSDWKRVEAGNSAGISQDELRSLTWSLWSGRVDELLNARFAQLLDSSTNKVISWQTLRDNVDYVWSSEGRQRQNGQMSLLSSTKALEDCDTVRSKIADRDDSLIDLDSYRDILSISGVAGKLYWAVEKLYWNGEYDRAREGFEFFLLPENKDGFTKGASHFYLGRMAAEIPAESIWYPSDEAAAEDALYHLLQVGAYPTCLTYISYSYVIAAQVYNSLDHPKQALALVMVDVPSVDWKYMKFRRNFDAAIYSLGLDDMTNYVRHAAECLRYTDKTSDYIRGKLPLMVSDAQWNALSTNLFAFHDAAMAIGEAISDSEEIPQGERLYEALTRRWPDMKALPDSIATNRVLNNNVLKF